MSLRDAPSTSVGSFAIAVRLFLLRSARCGVASVRELGFRGPHSAVPAGGRSLDSHAGPPSRCDLARAITYFTTPRQTPGAATRGHSRRVEGGLSLSPNHLLGPNASTFVAKYSRTSAGTPA